MSAEPPVRAVIEDTAAVPAPRRTLHIVHTESSCGWGGQEIRILTEAGGMIARGHRVTLLCPPGAPILAAAQARNIPVMALPIARKNLRGLHAIHRWLRTHPVDVVNVHSSTDSWLTALACRLLRSAPPIVRTRHVSAPVPDNRATHWLYQNATCHIVTTGERLRRQLIVSNRYDPERITSVPTGIDPQRFMPGDRREARKRLGLETDATIIGIVATLRSWKGHDDLIDAFADIRRSDLRLLIVGDGPRHRAIAQRIASLPARERILLAGQQDDVLPWLQAMDLFVLPSYANEGVPQAILQAMACALPVISTPVGSIPEIIEDQRTGILARPRDRDSLRQAMLNLLEDAGLRRRLGRAARDFVQQHFTTAIMLDRMERIFLEACH